jgi:nucleoside-diphosphate-sugar epimerase
MKVFVTGATGYIGFAVATALRRAGHEVWGLARSGAKASRLARHEIRPVIGNLQDPATFRVAAEACSVLVHAASDHENDMFSVDRLAVEALLAVAERGPGPKTLLYTSGIWIYGDTGGEAADETTPIAPPARVTPRPVIEHLVLGASHVRPLVLRPGCVYGAAGGLTGGWFRAAHADKIVRAIGTGANRWAMVHVDDLADCYVRAAESGLASEIFNVNDRSRASVRDMTAAVCCITGVTQPVQFTPVAEAAAKMGSLAECLALDQHVDSRKAVRLLGWQPRHGGFVDGIASYHAAWQAWQQV